MKVLTMSAARRRDKVVILTGPSYGASLSTPRVESLTPRVKFLTPRVKFLTPRVKFLTPRVKFLNLPLFAIFGKMLRALFCNKACGVFCCIGLLAMWIFVCLEDDKGIGYSCLAMMPWMIAFTIREMKKGVTDEDTI